MAQTTALINTLKKALKAKGKTYVDVATTLNLTEASVKRLFSQRDFSLQRLEEICELIGLEITDLVQMMFGELTELTELSEEAEQEIASDLVLLLITVCVLNKCTLEDIRSRYDLPETVCIQKLARLDRLKVIELQPGNRVKLLVASNFAWREDGPIQRFFQEKIESEFFNSRFDKEYEKLIVMNGMLSKASNLQFQRKLDRLQREFDEMITVDARLPMSERYGNTVVLAMRPWRYGLFAHLTKDEK